MCIHSYVILLHFALLYFAYASYFTKWRFAATQSCQIMVIIFQQKNFFLRYIHFLDIILLYKNFYMHCETPKRKVMWLALLQYLLYCGGMETNPQYLQCLPIITDQLISLSRKENSLPRIPFSTFSPLAKKKGQRFSL